MLKTDSRLLARKEGSQLCPQLPAAGPGGAAPFAAGQSGGLRLHSLPPRCTLSLGSISQLFMEMTLCSGRDSVSSQMIMQSRHELAEMSWDFLFLCISSANALKISWEGSLGIFSAELTLTWQLIVVSSPKDSYIEKKLKNPFPIPSCFPAVLILKMIIFLCCILKIAALSTHNWTPPLSICQHWLRTYQPLNRVTCISGGLVHQVEEEKQKFNIILWAQIQRDNFSLNIWAA